MARIMQIAKTVRTALDNAEPCPPIGGIQFRRLMEYLRRLASLSESEEQLAVGNHLFNFGLFPVENIAENIYLGLT
jgi:hypothetical protein